MAPFEIALLGEGVVQNDAKKRHFARQPDARRLRGHETTVKWTFLVG